MFYNLPIGALGDSTSVKTRVTHLQIVAVTTLSVLVSTTNGSYNQPTPKRNLASLVAKKLLQPSNENCLDVLHQFLRHEATSLCVLGLLAELCVLSKDFSLHLLRQSKWIASLTKHLTSCSGNDADCEETCCVLRVMCAMVASADEIATE